MIEINLIPDVKQELIKAQRVRSTVVATTILIGMVSVGVVVALAIYVFTIQTVRGSLLDNSIKDKNAEFVAVKDVSKTLTIQNQLTKISDLNSNKKIDSRIFNLLSAIIPPAPNDVQLYDLTIDSTTNTITINGQATNSYAAVEVFKKTIEGAKAQFNNADDKSTDKPTELTLASSISTSNTSYGEDPTGAKVLRFTISFVYTPELFSPATKNVSVIITTQGNATDSYLGVPASFFTDPATDLTGGQ